VSYYAVDDRDIPAAKSKLPANEHEIIKACIDINALPLSIINSLILNQKDLGQLATGKIIPLIDPAFDDDTLKNIIQYYSINPEEMEKELHIYAKQLLNEGKVNEAWQVLLALI
jgi:hypothetical protein